MVVRSPAIREPSYSFTVPTGRFGIVITTVTILIPKSQIVVAVISTLIWEWR
jgi:hypothetical protein